MDLLQENQNRKKDEKTPAQKVVFKLLVISIILCIITGIAMACLYLQGEKKPYSISICGKTIDVNKLQLFTTENGQKYVSLKSLSSNLGYDYYNGEFKKAEESKNKGYIDNKSTIIQFFKDSKEIYKTSESSKTDYQFYNLKNPILSMEDILYISLDDIDMALNLVVSYSQANNQTTIQTPEYWISKNTEPLSKNGIAISNTPENIKTLSYGYVVISKDNKYGVISLAGEELIGNKYNSITFCEYTKKFIVSNSKNEYGIITKSGYSDVKLQYDSIEIINFKPLLYSVKKLDKYEIMNGEGVIISEKQYEAFGYPENKSKGNNYTLIIPTINENIKASIIVKNNSKYGLIDLETGKEILNCNLDGIYSATSKEGKTYYVVEIEKQIMFLEDYIDNLNRLTATVD